MYYIRISLLSFLYHSLGIALLEFGVYEMDFLIHITSLELMSFLKMRFYPTLILNAAFIIVAAYPLKRYFERYAESLEMNNFFKGMNVLQNLISRLRKKENKQGVSN